MPRKRKKNNNWPKYVYDNNGTVIYRPWIPVEKRHLHETDKNGFLRPPIKLCKLSDPERILYRAYAAAADRIAQAGETDKNTLGWLKKQYLKSKRFAQLKPGTQDDYEQKLNKMLSFPVKVNGKAGKVEDIHISTLTKPLLRRLLDRMLDDYQKNGMSGLSTVNGQFRCLSAMLRYGIQYHDNIGIETNPCIGIELHKENKRDRYVTDKEYKIQLEHARKKGADYLPVLFELAYLLASRSIEVTDLLKANVTEEGIRVERRKGSKTNIITWSPRLKAAYDEAIALQKKREKLSPYVFPNSKGQKFSRSGLQSAMARFKKSMIEAGLGDIFWTLHDLKRKGMTDAKNKNIGGHKTQAMKDLYDQSVERIAPPK